MKSRTTSLEFDTLIDWSYILELISLMCECSQLNEIKFPKFILCGDYDF
jgi:hypothetical protein